MAKKFRDLVATTMSPGQQASARARARALRVDLALQELRQARGITQGAVAERLDTTQPEVSKIEHRADVYLSTLRRYIEALGGTLELVAHFADGDVRITQFD